MITYIVTCHEDNCENNEIAIEMIGVEDMVFICGPCANEISDVTIN